MKYSFTLFILLCIATTTDAQYFINDNVVAGTTGSHWQGFKSNGPATTWGFQQNDVMYVGIGGNLYSKGFSTNAMGIFNGSLTKEDVFLFNQNSGNADFLVLKNTGNIGIGISTPTEKLHVHAVSGTAEFRLTDALTGTPSGTGAYFRLNSNQNVDIMNFQSGKLLQLGTSGAARLTIDGNGNIGIGTASPSSPWSKVLQVYDFNNAALSVKTPVADWQLVTDASGGLHFRHVLESGNTARMFISSNGNIGIGTTDPQDKLVVAGNMQARKVKVTVNAGADFVFEPNYRLRTLEEVKQYIQQYKHLPEIPSAKEMESTGIELAEMNIKLLQKVEELTLYLIEQKQEIDELRKKLQTLTEDK